jgi:hypothetical protein
VKKEKMTTKEKRGEPIIWIAMAAVMVALVLVAMVPTGMARLTAKQVDCTDTIFISEQGLTFDLTDAACTGAPDGIYGDSITLEAVNPDIPDTLSLSATYTVPRVEKGKYYYDVDSSGTFNTGDPYIFVQKAEISGDIILNNRAQDSIDGLKVPPSTKIVFKAELNFGDGKIPGAQFEVQVIGPDSVGIETIDGQDLTNLDATRGTIIYVGDDGTAGGTTTRPPPYAAGAIALADLDTGTYTVKIKTDKIACNMLDSSSGEMDFTIRSEALSIEAKEDEVGRGEDIIVTVTGNPCVTYYFAIENVVDYEEPEIVDTPDIKNSQIGTGEGAAGSKTAAWIKTGNDGIADLKIKTTKAYERTYTMNVYDDPVDIRGKPFAEGTYPAPMDIYDAHNDANVDVVVTEAIVVFDIPSKVAIGEMVIIKGAVNAGDTVDILIDDEYAAAVDGKGDNIDIDKNNEFEVKWNTEGYIIGSYTIKAYIDCDCSDYDCIEDNVRYEDGSTMILLVAPELTARQPRNVVAEEDDYIIEGTATGVDDIDIVLVGPEGYPAADPGFDVLNGLEITSSSVNDDEFSNDIVMAEGLDYGTWITMVFSAGRDGVYGDWCCEAGNLRNLFDGDPVSLKGRSQSQIVSLIKDCTIDTAGSDDLLVEFPFVVETPYVEFNPIESVTIGEPLELTGITNREPETVIVISTCAGPMDFPAVMTQVEWSTSDQGIFTATIDTTYALPGTYTFEADDGDGHTDKATVELLPAVSTFDTGVGTYPSIFGTHNGTIIPARDLNVSTLYTYPGPGTGGHTKSIALYEHKIPVAYGTWSGYTGEWYNVTIHNVSGAPYVMLLEDHEYNYTLRTGSYPQIIHRQNHTTLDGSLITCTEFIDANGRRYSNWIPAIRLE